MPSKTNDVKSIKMEVDKDTMTHIETICKQDSTVKDSPKKKFIELLPNGSDNVEDGGEQTETSSNMTLSKRQMDTTTLIIN